MIHQPDGGKIVREWWVKSSIQQFIDITLDWTLGVGWHDGYFNLTAMAWVVVVGGCNCGDINYMQQCQVQVCPDTNGWWVSGTRQSRKQSLFLLFCVSSKCRWLAVT